MSCFLLPTAVFKTADPAVSLTILELDEGLETDGDGRADDVPEEALELGLDVVDDLLFNPEPP